MYPKLISVCELQKAVPLGHSCALPSRDRDIHPGAATCFEKMDTRPAFQRTHDLAFSLPCPLPTVQDGGSNGCAGERRGPPCVGRPTGQHGCGHRRCGRSSPSAKTHSPILQVEKQTL